MADESMELEDGQLPVVNGPSSSSAAAADVQLRAQLDETTQVLRHQGQLNLARLVHALVELDLHDAMWVLDDDVRDDDDDFSGDHALFDAFRHWTRWHLFNLSQEAGYEEHDVSAVIAQLVLWVAQLAAAGLLRLDDDNDDTTQSYRNGNGGGGGGAVPASAATAVHRLVNQTFHAGGNESLEEGGCGITECSICFEEFVDGGQVSVMPCPSRGHRFHPKCIAKWLRINNTCPLCRHEVPAY